MAAIYCRFFKVPGTFEPPNETIGGDIVEAVLGSLIGKTEKSKNKSGSYRPKSREDGHPASMLKPRSVVSPEEIDALAPEIVKALAELRKDEHMTLRTRAFGSQGRGGPKCNESEDVTTVTIRFCPTGKFLGLLRGARPQVSGQR